MYFKVKLAELVIGVECRYETTKWFCKDYLVEDEDKDIEVKIEDRDIENERQTSLDVEQEKEGTEKDISVKKTEYRNEYLETLALLRKISERLPEYNCFLMHGAVAAADGKGYMFTAPSGTGKSTHINLWKKYYANVTIVNGDKPFIRIKDSGVWAYGTPWAGKEGWQENVTVPLRAICILGRGEDNRIEKMSLIQALPYIMRQIHYTDDPDMAGRILELLDQMMADVPIYWLECDMSREAAECSYKELVMGCLKK